MSIEKIQAGKHRVWSFWNALDDLPASDLTNTLGDHLHPNFAWHGPEPIGHLHDADAFASAFWQPLKQSFPDLKRQHHIFMAGQSNGRVDGMLDGHFWVGGTGYLVGTFANDYLAIPASGKQVSIRWGEFCRIEDDRIIEIYCLLDYVDLMQQVGIAVLPPSRGRDGLYPPPAAGDGVLHAAQNEDISAYTLEHIRRFIFEGLNHYDQADLSSMGMAGFFHPELRWYGPGGIGACLSFKEFEDFHQKHWLHAYPDREVQNLDALIAEGPYSGAPGWAGVIGTHSGEYLDVAATGKRIEFNGLDFWKLENDRYIENWVFVDMVHVFQQFGVDLFKRCQQQRHESL